MSADPRSTALTVLAAVFGMNLLARGVSETYALFLLPIGEEFAWSRSRLTSVYSVYMIVHGLAAPLAGLAVDRYGPRSSYLIGLVCLGGGYLAAGRLDALWQFHLCIGVLGGIGVATLGVIPAQALISRWYRARLATAMGVAYAGLGSGVIVVVPLTQMIIEHSGWRAAYTVLGVSLLVLILAVAAAPWRRWWRGHPAIHVPGPTEKPHVGEPRTVASRSAERLAGTPPTATSVAGRSPPAGGWTLRAAMAEGAFWGLFAIFFFTAVSVFATSIQIPAYLVSLGFAPVAAATAFGMLGLLSTAGMMLSGMFADRLGRRPTATATYSLTIGGLVALWLLGTWPSIGVLALFVVAFGLAMGSRGPLVSELSAKLYGGGRAGAIYGAVTLGMGLGASIGSWVSGLLFDLTGDYAAVFAFSAVTAVLGLAQFWLVPALATGRR